MSIVMGIDYGSKRIGIALSNSDATVAFPHTVLENSAQVFERMCALITDMHVTSIVVGESRNLNGAPNPINDAIEQFAGELEKRTGIDIIWEQEFYTSQQVERDFGKNAMLDASAAALILQSYLDKAQNA